MHEMCAKSVSLSKAFGVRGNINAITLYSTLLNPYTDSYTAIYGYASFVVLHQLTTF